MVDYIALQAYVLRGAGAVVSSIKPLHVNTAYVRGPNGIRWTDFFARLDDTDAVAAEASISVAQSVALTFWQTR